MYKTTPPRDQRNTFALRHKLLSTVLIILILATGLGAVFGNLLLGFVIGLLVTIWYCIDKFGREMQYELTYERG